MEHNGLSYRKVVICNGNGNFSTNLVTGYKHHELKNITAENMYDIFGSDFGAGGYSVKTNPNHINFYYPEKGIALLVVANSPASYGLKEHGLLVDFRVYSAQKYKAGYSKSARFYPVNPFHEFNRKGITMLIHKALDGRSIFKPLAKIEKVQLSTRVFGPTGSMNKCEAWASFVYDSFAGRLLGFQDDFGLPCVSIALPKDETVRMIVDKYAAFVTRFIEKREQIGKTVKTIADANKIYEDIFGFDKRWEKKFGATCQAMYSEVNGRINYIFGDLNVQDLFALARAEK